jgi:hypothetical protein
MQDERGMDIEDKPPISLGVSERSEGTSEGNCVARVQLSALQRRLEDASSRRCETRATSGSSPRDSHNVLFHAASLQVWTFAWSCEGNMWDAWDVKTGFDGTISARVITIRIPRAETHIL